jgi:putative SOS response-associated peptidase YedK
VGKRNRGVVLATSFCEYADTKPRKTPMWFALSEDRLLFAFAGLWTLWRGVRGRKSAPVDGHHELFGFLTTEANAIVSGHRAPHCRQQRKIGRCCPYGVFRLPSKLV